MRRRREHVRERGAVGGDAAPHTGRNIPAILRNTLARRRCPAMPPEHARKPGRDRLHIRSLEVLLVGGLAHGGVGPVLLILAAARRRPSPRLAALAVSRPGPHAAARPFVARPNGRAHV